jgi:hypothetical protein
MSTLRRWRPEVEALEDRTALSTLPAVFGPPAPHAAHHRLVLRGQIGGTWSRVPTLPDTGGLQTLTGSGTVMPLGTVQADGQLHTPGFVPRGRTEVTLHLMAAGGSITVRLVGPLQKGFSGPPFTFRYTITGGTGNYVGATGGGAAGFHELTLVMDPLPCPPNALCVQPATFVQTFVISFRRPVVMPL